MNKLPLLDVPHVTAAKSANARLLRVAVAAERFAGAIVRQGILDSRLLTSVHEKTVSVDLWKTKVGPEQLARDNPLLSPAQRESLDERGLVRERAIVEEGGILASIILATGDRLLFFVPPQANRQKENLSCRVPAGWSDAVVQRVRLLSPGEIVPEPPKDVRERAEFELRAERNLELGDVLLINDLPLTVFGFRTDQEMPSDDAGNVVDLLVSADEAPRFGLTLGSHRSLPVSKADSRAQDVLESRATGPCTLITIQPLGSDFSAPGQEVTAAQIQWLRAHGLEANLSELVCLKSDDLAAREQAGGSGKSQLWQAIAGRRGGAPESLAIFATWLESLGVRVDLQPADGCVSLALTPATDIELAARSHGGVRLPETINYRTYAETEGGLFCPHIFGSAQGRRRRQFGHVRLTSAIVPILWRLGRPCLLETILRLSTAKIEKIVRYEADVFIREGKVRQEKRPVESTVELTDEGWERLGTGAAAVAALLSRVPSERIPLALQNRLGALTSNVVLIPPADMRPLVLLDSGNFATHDANDLIRRIVNRENRLSKLIQLNAPQVILDNEHQMLQLTVDAFQANCSLSSKDAVHGSGNEKRRLICALDMVVRDLLEPNGKRVDWSGRARTVVCLSPAGEFVLVPDSLFHKLELSETEPILLTVDQGDGRFIARLPRPACGSALQIDQQAASELGVPDGIAHCIVHRPLGPAAKNEARQLMQARAKSTASANSRGGWLERTTSAEIISGLVQAATTGERVHLDSPALLALGGTGCVNFLPDPGRS